MKTEMPWHENPMILGKVLNTFRGMMLVTFEGASNITAMDVYKRVGEVTIEGNSEEEDGRIVSYATITIPIESYLPVKHRDFADLLGILEWVERTMDAFVTDTILYSDEHRTIYVPLDSDLWSLEKRDGKYVVSININEDASWS